jgi:hypothetical protein
MNEKKKFEISHIIYGLLFGAFIGFFITYHHASYSLIITSANELEQAKEMPMNVFSVIVLSTGISGALWKAFSKTREAFSLGYSVLGILTGYFVGSLTVVLLSLVIESPIVINSGYYLVCGLMLGGFLFFGIKFRNGISFMKLGKRDEAYGDMWNYKD